MSDYKPVAGEECEFRTEARNEWERITPEYIGESFFVFHNNGNEMVIEHKWAEFRPIRTKEDIEREEAIEDIKNIIDSYTTILSVNPLTMNVIASKIVGKGYFLVGEKVDAETLKFAFNRSGNPVSNGMALGDAKWLIANYDIYMKVEK